VPTSFHYFFFWLICPPKEGEIFFSPHQEKGGASLEELMMPFINVSRG